MTPKDAIQYFGSLSKLARAVGAAVSTVHEWTEKNQIPECRQYQIELATGGVLVADKPARRDVDSMREAA